MVSQGSAHAYRVWGVTEEVSCSKAAPQQQRLLECSIRVVPCGCNVQLIAVPQPPASQMGCQWHTACVMSYRSWEWVNWTMRCPMG